MQDVELIKTRLKDRFSGLLQEVIIDRGEVTIRVNREDLYELCLSLRDESGFEFQQLTDVTAVDYLQYGKAEWQTESATNHGFSRGAAHEEAVVSENEEFLRFAVVYHLLSIRLNQRLRVKVLLKESDLSVESVVDIWPSANWAEREVYDLFGIVFSNHPDLRRILTDYGFVGHPLRKDFPLSGHVEVRYDAKLGKVVYGPLEIEPRVLVPKVIRHDNRYLNSEEIKAHE